MLVGRCLLVKLGWNYGRNVGGEPLLLNCSQECAVCSTITQIVDYQLTKSQDVRNTNWAYPAACFFHPMMVQAMLPTAPTKRVAGHRKTAIMKNIT